ncbi:MAG TPA: T9SS type A sorting domain-containing protein, partial [Saprospiraceae bacterium]|nr:T9SS type A sorting domain-containing protein [Saprospiraceae bacterium]
TDSSLIGNGIFDGENHFSYYNNYREYCLRDKDFLYMFNSTQIKCYQEGGFIVKIDLITGKPIWWATIDLRTEEKQEFLEDMYLAEGMLHVVTARRIADPEYFPDGFSSQWNWLGDSSLISVRKYDSESGMLVGHIRGDPSNTNLLRIKNSIATSRQLYGLKDGTFFYNEIVTPGILSEETESWYNQYKIDELGNILENEKRDTIRFEKEVDSVNINRVGQSNINRIKRISIDSLITIQYWINNFDQNFDKQPSLVIYDQHLDKVKNLKLDEAIEGINFKTLRLGGANHNYILLHAPIWEQDLYDTLAPLWEFLVFDYEGNLVRRFNNEPEEYRHHYMIFHYLEDEGEFLMAVQAHYLEGPGIKFYKTKPGGGLQFLKKLTYDYNEHVLVFRYLDVLDNGDLLIQGNNRAPDPSTPNGIGYAGDWPTLMRFRAEDVGLSADKGPVEKLQYVHIYPNPVRTYLNLDSLKAENVILRIYDLTGRQVMSHPAGFAGQRFLKMDVSSLGAGFYILKVFDAQGKLLGSNKFIKVE